MTLDDFLVALNRVGGLGKFKCVSSRLSAEHYIIAFDLVIGIAVRKLRT